MSESARIGVGSCPVCGSDRAHFTVSKKQLVCVTCNTCNTQIFARSDRSDELLRARIKTAKTPAPEAPKLEAPEPKPVQAEEQKAVREIASKTEKRRSFLEWSN